MIVIDGDYGEGGGQIIRTALALSALTGKSFQAENIRQGRCTAGLKAQHVWCVKTVGGMCNARTDGAELSSSKLVFEPGALKPGDIKADIGTSGSIALLLQAVMPVAVFSPRPVKIKVIGGTDGRFAMPFDYFKNVFLPSISWIAGIEAEMTHRGYFPKGQGEVKLRVSPRFSIREKEPIADFIKRVRASCPRICLTGQGRLIAVKGISHASPDLKARQVAERQASAARKALAGLGCRIKIERQYCDTASRGSGICLWACFDAGKTKPILGSDALGEPRKSSEQVGREAASRLLDEIKSKAAVDSHLADQLMVFMAFTGGRIKTSKITPHCLTNKYVMELFLGECFEVDKEGVVIEAR
ncbi:RNA 3'-terminal-phosphate cyclase [Candidatus Woesearchaeota archaeon CG1_02_47_18]|nr:MAG: RNA 3'-terminal-phosphate cyclase [Candidatus Woesearchaeota archaeon CG1_02_47_18]